MRVLQISNYYYPHIGGIEEVARSCVRALTGVSEQRVFCFNHERKNVSETVDDTPIIRAGCFAKIASQSLSFGYRTLLKRQFEEFRPDVVIFHFPNPFAAHFLLPLLKKYPACKLVVWYHLDITKQKILGKFFKGQTERLLKRAERVVATTPNYVEGSPFLTSVREKCDIIPCCIFPERFTPREEDYEEERRIRSKYTGKTLLFAMGRHVPYKGIEYLVRASRYLGDRYAVLIGGEGPLTKSLKKLARGDEKIVFLGKIPADRRIAYLLAADIFCFPSITKNEAFGIALAEAMYLGKPTVTFTIPHSGVNYVSLNGVTGIEVENSDAKAFAEAIETLASDPALREKYGNAARERVETHFAFGQFRENLTHLLEKI